MAESANIQSVESLKALRAALLKFAEAADAAVADAESETARATVWLQHEQPARWRGQLRKRQEMLGRAREALRMKTLFKDSTGRPYPADEEQKAVRRAAAAVDEAEHKLQAIKRWTALLQKEIFDFQGAVQRLSGGIRSDLPRAVAMLDHAVSRLNEYASPAENQLQSPPVIQPEPDEEDRTDAQAER